MTASRRTTKTKPAAVAVQEAPKITTWDRLCCPSCNRPTLRIGGTRTTGAVKRRYHYCTQCGRHAHSEELADGSVRWTRADRGRKMAFSAAE